MMKTIKDIGEFGFIKSLQGSSPKIKSTLLGIGDDTAVLKGTSKEHLLLTTDSLVEDRHFSLRKDTGLEIGWKAMGRNVSDLAAMGGYPTHAVVALACPEKTPLTLLNAIYRGMQKAAGQFQFDIVGGDTSGHSKIVLSVTMLGEVSKKNLVLRSGAKPGDVIFCTGNLGGSLMGKHKRFIPRLREAQLLVGNFKVHSMIDISDGLAQDLNHILKASRVGATLMEQKIPLSRAVRSKFKARKTRIQHALCDGEDYELLFTLGQTEANLLEDFWKQKKMKTSLNRIGTVHKNGNKNLQHPDGTLSKLTLKGYRHF